jgi:hypothetical protein
MSKLRSASPAALVWLVAASAAGQAQRSDLKDTPTEALESLYLFCHGEAIRGRLAREAIMQCSVVYEELKWRAFEGDFEKLNHWAKSMH